MVIMKDFASMILVFNFYWQSYSLLNIDTEGAGDGDINTSGGHDGIFGIFNTSNSGKVVFPIKDSGGSYNNILEM